MSTADGEACEQQGQTGRQQLALYSPRKRSASFHTEIYYLMTLIATNVVWLALFASLCLLGKNIMQAFVHS